MHLSHSAGRRSHDREDVHSVGLSLVIDGGGIIRDACDVAASFLVDSALLVSVHHRSDHHCDHRSSRDDRDVFEKCFKIMNAETIRRLIDDSSLSSEDRADLNKKLVRISSASDLRELHAEVLRRRGGVMKGYQSKIQRDIETR
jgi:hypothetical protein